MKHVNPFKHTTAEDYEHFLSYMWASGARHNALLCKAYFDGADAPHEEYEAYMAAHPEQAEQEPVAWMRLNEKGECENIEYIGNFDEHLYLPPSCQWLYAAPVRTKDLTDEEQLELARSSVGKSRHWLVAAVIAADRELNR